MEQCALELGTLWGAATIDENFASINPSSPITCLSRWSKNPFGEAKWAFYVPPLRLEEAHRQKHTVVGTHKQRHHKWEVSVSLRGLTLISWQRNTWPLFYFYQDHLRIDQVPTSLWHRHENKINSDVLFIYFSSTDICYIMGCFHKRMSQKPRQYWCKVASCFRQTKWRRHICPCPSPLFPFAQAYLELHHDFSYSFIFLLSCRWLFLFHPSITIYLHICKFDTAFSSALLCFRPACRTSIKLRPVDSAQSPPFSVLFLDDCLSVSLSGKICPSVCQ